MSDQGIRPMNDLECRLWRDRNLAQSQLLAVASVLAGDDKGETQDHARWTPALDSARRLERQRSELAEALRSVLPYMNLNTPNACAAFDNARTALARLDGEGGEG